MGYRASAHRRYAAKRLRKQIAKRWVRLRPYVMWLLGAAIVIGGIGMFVHRLFFASRFVIDTVRFAPGATAVVATTGHLDWLTEQRTDTNYYFSRYWHLRGVRKRAKKQYPMIDEISLAYGGSATAHADVTYHRPSMYVIVGSGDLQASWASDRVDTLATTDATVLSGDTVTVTVTGDDDAGTQEASVVSGARDEMAIESESAMIGTGQEEVMRERVWGVSPETVVLGLYGETLVPLVSSAVQIRASDPMIRVAAGFDGLDEDDWAVFFGEIAAQDVRDDIVAIGEELGGRQTGEEGFDAARVSAPLQIYYMPGVYRSIVTLADGSAIHLSHTRDMREQLAVYHTIMADPSIGWVDVSSSSEPLVDVAGDAQTGDTQTAVSTRVRRPISRIDLGSSPSQAFVVFGDE